MIKNMVSEKPASALLFARIRLERKEMWRLVIFAATSGLLSLAVPITAQGLIDTVSFGVLLQPVFVLLTFLTFALICVALTQLAQRALVEVMMQRLWMQSIGASHQQLTGPHVSERLPFGRLANRFFDVVTVDKSFSMVLTSGVGAILQVLAGLALLAVYHPLLLALDFLVVGAMLAVALRWWKTAATSAVKESSAKYATADWLAELAEADDLWHHASMRNFASQRTEALASRWLGARQHHFRRVLRQQAAFLALETVTTVALLAIGGWLVLERQLAVGQLVAAEIVVTMTVAQISKFGKLFEKIYDLLAGLKKMEPLVNRLSLTNREPSLHPQTKAVANVGMNSAAPEHGMHIRLSSVKVFDDSFPLEAVVRPGSSLWLSGAEGAGKTRLLRMFASEVTPASGMIFLDDAGLPDVEWGLSTLCLGSWPTVLPLSLLDNLTLGTDVSIDNIWNTIEEVGLSSFASQQKNGLQTMISPHFLSHSQRIKMAIARAIIVQPRLLLLDESLDLCSRDARAQLLDALLKLKNTTLVCITQHEDLSCRFDQNLHLDRGRIKK